MSSEAFYRVVDRKERAHQLPVDYQKRPVAERVTDFDEINCGFDWETARAEASRCIQCPEPQACVLNCPAGNNIPDALWLISQGNFVEAAQVFAQTNPLSDVCGRVCPNLCQQGCVLSRYHGAPAIGKLEACVSTLARQAGALAIEPPQEKSGKRVAVVGAGPAGITVAEDLIKRGHDVTVYEAWPVAGGVLVYGIPSFKLNKNVVLNKVRELEKTGVKFITNTRIGATITIESLQKEYDAVFLGTGANLDASMNIPGESLAGIFKSSDFLIRANVPAEMLPADRHHKPEVGRRVAVIGGGDTAVDCARTAVRLGADQVTIYYRRTEAEMPGNKSERAICLEEGVAIEYLQTPVEYVGDPQGRLTAVKLARTQLGEPDASGRRRPVIVEGSEFVEPVDTVILAVGYWPDPSLAQTTQGLRMHKWGLLFTDEQTGATSRPGVFAAGDNVHGPDLVITAIADAHRVARSIDAYLHDAPLAWGVSENGYQ